MSIVDLYKRDSFNNTLRVGTPDPTKYHDLSQVTLEHDGSSMASKVAASYGYSGLKGTIIPRSTRQGGSRGGNHMVPKPAFIDPELTGGRLIIDPKKMIANPGLVRNAIKKAQEVCTDDPADNIIAAYAEIADTVVETTSRPVEVVVTPKTTAAKPVALTSFIAKPSVVPPPTPQQLLGQSAASGPAKTLKAEFSATEPARTSQTAARELRRVVFELPVIGQLTCFYHDVVVGDGVLVLVYDHSHPSQMLWFPPEQEQGHSPTAIAVLVSSKESEPETLYLAYPTGIRFIYRTEEFCILTVDQSKLMK